MPSGKSRENNCSALTDIPCSFGTSLLDCSYQSFIMQTLRQDIAYAFRQMRQSPVFTLTAMLTL
ncbi:MAG: hypothetical protein WBX22_23325, partial [Silvibacterium sp.]